MESSTNLFQQRKCSVPDTITIDYDAGNGAARSDLTWESLTWKSKNGTPISSTGDKKDQQNRKIIEVKNECAKRLFAILKRSWKKCRKRVDPGTMQQIIK